MWLTCMFLSSLFSSSISESYGISPREFGFTLPNALQLLLFIVANLYRTSFFCIPDTDRPLPHLPPSSTSAVSLSGPYTFSLCLYAFSSFTHTMNVGVTRDSLLGSPGGSVVKNLSARAGDMSSIPDLGRPSTAKNQSINQYFFNKGSRLHPLLHILPP